MENDRHPDRQEAAPQYLRGLGARVFALRRTQHLSRRVLAEKAGVSSRYLAQVESGDANPSIGVLHRIATALDCSIDEVVSDGADQSISVAARFSRSNSQTQAAVLALLASSEQAAPLRNGICLIGLRGAGKSTLGVAVAAELGLRFVQLNDVIEEASGMPIAEVMALYGPEGYRLLEAQALEVACENDEMIVLEVAGGIVSDPQSYDRLLTRFRTIWVRATPSEHMARVRAQGDERPMAGNPKAMDDLVTLLKSREALYARAEAVIDTSGKSVEASAAEMLALISDDLFSVSARIQETARE